MPDWLYTNADRCCTYASPGAREDGSSPVGQAFGELPAGELTEVTTGGLLSGYLIRLARPLPGVVRAKVASAAFALVLLADLLGAA